MLLPIYPTVSSPEALMNALIQWILLVLLFTYLNVNNVVLIYHALSKRKSDQARQTEHNKGILIGIISNKKIKYLFQRVTNVPHSHIICICSKHKYADMFSRL